MRFVVVNGPPGSGKTTISETLAARLKWPLISKDTIKKTLGDSLKADDARWSHQLSAASYEVLWALAASCPQAILEGNFRPVAADRLRALDDDSVEVFLRCPLEICRERFEQRIVQGSRHPVHPPTVPPLEFFGEFDRPLAVGRVIEVRTDRVVDMNALIESILQDGRAVTL